MKAYIELTAKALLKGSEVGCKEEFIMSKDQTTYGTSTQITNLFGGTLLLSEVLMDLVDYQSC